MDHQSPSRPNIVLITPYYQPVVGGLTTFVTGLGKELVRRGAAVTVLTREGIEGPGVRRGPSNALAFVHWCRTTVREIAPDIIHCHGHWYCLAGALSKLGNPLAPRVVFTVHTVPDLLPVLRMPFRWLLHRAHVITFVSERSQREFVDRFGLPDEWAVVSPGVSDLLAKTTVAPRGDSKGFRICAMSLMSYAGKVQGIRVLMEATARLARSVPETSLTLVGDGELRPDLEATGQKLDLGDRVRFAGSVPDPVPILASSDAFCHISFRDSFPQAVLEAMSLSVPVIVNEGVLEDPIFRSPDSGVLHCPSDPDGVFQALRKLAADPVGRRRLGAQGRELALREFSWHRQADRFWAVYGLTPGPKNS